MSDRSEDAWFNFWMVLLIFVSLGFVIYGISITDNRHQSMVRWCEMKGYKSYHKDVDADKIYCIGAGGATLQIPPEMMEVFGDGTIRGQFK